MTMYDYLFKPLPLGQLTLPNRVCFLAHRTNFGRYGLLNDRHIAYYRRRALGGCGLIILGELSMDHGDRPWETMIEAYTPSVIPAYRKLSEAIHEPGSFLFAQLTHHGFQSSGSINRLPVLGPSALADVAFGETAKAMEPEDIDHLLKAFSRSARLVREGGLDGIEIDAGPESVLRQFISPLSNHRQDEYGGSLDNRMRLMLQVIDVVRQAVGEDFTVGVNLCVDEKFWGAITIDESQQFARIIENTGKVDFINTSVGTYYNLHLVLASMHTPQAFSVGLTEQIKNTVKIPVMASHQIHSPELANEILSKGQADLIGLVRPLICDPDFAGKAKQGNGADIRHCVMDNKGCLGRTNQSKALGCIQNPEVGREDVPDEKSRVPGPSKKKVMVIGGGPAGLEAARAARERGHEVVIYEKLGEVGGQINLIKKRPGRQGMEEVIRYLKHALEKLQVPIMTGIELTPDLVLAKKPDAVIVTTGSKPRSKPVPGEYGPPRVLNVWDVIEGRFPVGERVLFIDENGGHHATATVELLADQGKKVDMVTSDLFIGIELASMGDLYLSRQRLLQKGVTFLCDVIIDAIDQHKVMARNIYTNEEIVFQDYDSVVLDLGNAVEDQLYRELKGRVKELYRAGDCVAPRGIDMAILEGRSIGERV